MMKLRKITASCVVLSVILLSTLPHSSAQKNNPQIHRNIGAQLPELKIRDYFGIQYSWQDIIEERNFIVFLFNPTCYHCVEMTELILAHKEEMSETTVFFIASQDMLEILPQFMTEVEYTPSPNLIIGIDDSDIVSKLYNYGTLPQILIYNPERELIKIHNGEWDWDGLKEYIK